MSKILHQVYQDIKILGKWETIQTGIHEHQTTLDNLIQGRYIYIINEYMALRLN